MSSVAVLVLAAGSSRRMGGRDKLLMPVGDQPLLRRSVAAAVATGAPVTVVLPHGATDRRAALAGLMASIVEARHADEGMGASIREGIAGIGLAPGAMILPADMPELDTEDLSTVLAAFVSRECTEVVRGAGADGTPGHPVVFPRRLFPALAGLSGDTGARALLERESVRLVPLPDRHALTDLDTPADWRAWQVSE